MLYEALGGVNPVRAPGAAATARRVGMRLPSLARLRPDLPPELCAALDRALLPDPEDRGTLAELREELELARDDAGRDVGRVDTTRELEPARPRRTRELGRAAGRAAAIGGLRGAPRAQLRTGG